MEPYLNRVSRCYSANYKHIVLDSEVYALESGLFYKVKDLEHRAFLGDEDAAKEMCDLNEKYGYDFYYALHLNEKHRQRVKRLRKRIAIITKSNHSYFLTITFNEESLNNLNEDTRRQIVRRFLAEYSDNYVANIDYGKDHGREHYHAVASLKGKCGDFSKYGFVYFEKIRNNKACETKIAKYTCKLTLHALKETNKYKRLIYSR